MSGDAQFGFISFTHYTNAVILSWTTEYMLVGLGASGMFFCFALINVAGYFFVSCCMFCVQRILVCSFCAMGLACGTRHAVLVCLSKPIA